MPFYGMCAGAIAIATALIVGNASAHLLVPAGAVLATGAIVVTRHGLATALLGIMAVIAFTVPMNGLRVWGLLTVSDVLLVVAAFMIFISRLTISGVYYLQPYRPFIVAASLIVVGGLVGTLADATDLKGIGDLVRFAVSTLGVLFAIAAWAPSRQEVRLLVWAFALGATASVGTGLTFRRDASGRAIGLAAHSNHFAVIALLAFAAALGVFLSSRGGRQRLAMAMTGMLAVGILASGSRAGVGGVAVFVLAFLFSTQNWRILKWLGTAAVIFGVLIMTGTLGLSDTNAVGRLLGYDETVETSNQERSEARRATLESIDRRPVTGIGFTVAKEGHNVYLQTWAASGVIGLTGLCVIGVAVARRLWQGAQGSSLGPAMLSGYVGYLGAALFSPIFWDRYLWLYLALTMAVYAKSGQSEPVDGQRVTGAHALGRNPSTNPAW